MVTIPNPQTKSWTQTNSGEVGGTLFSSKNMDFNSYGYARLGLRPAALVYDIANFTDVVSMNYFIGTAKIGYYIMTGDNSGHPWLYDLSTGAGTDLSTDTGWATDYGGGSRLFDSCVWQGRWYVSSNTKFGYHDGNVNWVLNLGTLTTATPHPICVHEGLNYLGIGDGNTVLLYDTGHSLNTTLTLPSSFQVIGIRYHQNNYFIITKNKYGGNAAMFIWNGAGSAHQGMFPIRGQVIFAIEVYDSSVAIFTSIGQLMRFNGGGFDELAHLPCFSINKKWFSTSNGYSLGRISPRGMTVDANLIYINMDGTLADGTSLVNQPSGLWCYDPKIGLYHKAGYSNNKVEKRTISGVNTGTDIFTTGTSYTALTGTMVYYTSSASSSTALINGNFYFLIAVSGTTFKLAITYNNAIAGTAIDLTASGTGEVIYFCDSIDFGSTGHANVKQGAVYLISDSDSNSGSLERSTGSLVLYGAGDLNNYSGVGNVDTLQTLIVGENRSNIIIQKISSSQIKEAWQKIFTKYNLLFQGNDKVLVKYRTSDKINYPIYIAPGTMTWTAANIFTVMADLSNVVVGEEVEITSGYGAGNTFHISSISFNAGTYTVTLDESLGNWTLNNASGGFIQNWKKIGTGLYNIAGQFIESAVSDGSNKWIQVKLEIRGVSEPYIEELQIISQPFQQSK